MCMGNICRSPTAHGVVDHLLQENGLGERVHVDSAGTHDYHVGESPDRRAQQSARARGIDLSGIRARAAKVEDFERFDYVLAMDQDNLAFLRALCPREYQHKVQLFMEFSSRYGSVDVPDPYYGGAHGFERVLDMVEDAAQGLLAQIRKDLVRDR